MKKILILGAGMTASSLIKYMLDHAESNKWLVRLGDLSIEKAQKRINNHSHGEAFKFDSENPGLLEKEVKSADIVISLLPSNLHYLVSSSCVRNSKSLVTTSFLTPEIQKMDKEAREKEILLLSEMGVEPGVDHMSAMQVIDRIKGNGDSLIAFESATGGLIAPEYDNNPWRYKFTWAPRNVVLAGQGGARFYHNGKFKYIPYHKIFQRIETIDIPGLGEFEVYPNHDSLKYQSAYGLTDLLTMFRGTIRRPGFCKAWDLLVQLGATDDSFVMDNSENMTYREFTDSFLAYDIIGTVESKLANYLGIREDSELMDKLRWLGLFEDIKIGIPELTPARILQHILEQKWRLRPGDKDMIIMQHQFDYNHLGTNRRIFSNMVVYGEDQNYTAMSISVGLPVAIITKLILEGRIDLTGVHIPVNKLIYEPVLSELKDYGIQFHEKDIKLS